MLLKELGRHIVKGTSLLRFGEQIKKKCMNFYFSHDDDDDDRFYISLFFSAIEQTHCAFVACDSKWMTVGFYGAFWISTNVVYVQRCQFGCYTAGATWTCRRLGAFCVIIQSCSMSHHFMSCHDLWREKKGAFASFPGWPEDCECAGKIKFKNAVLDILLHEQQVPACCQTHSDYGPPKKAFKAGTVNFANWLSPPSIVNDNENK